MRQMALAIETDIPVYGLRARGVNPDEEPQGSVEEMARTYVDAIRAFQPQGPYRVAGHSFGALVAFEIARQLTQPGEEVGWLGLIDAELNTACLPRGGAGVPGCTALPPGAGRARRSPGGGRTRSSAGSRIG